MHTPGPWKVGSEQLRGGLYWYVAIPGAEETIDLHESENGEANARLIAAAPEMLASLKDALLCLEVAIKNQHPEWDGSVTPESSIGMARAAISKATAP